MRKGDNGMAAGKVRTRDEVARRERSVGKKKKKTLIWTPLKQH